MPSESHFRRSDGIFAPFVYKPLKSIYTQTRSKQNKPCHENPAPPHPPRPNRLRHTDRHTRPRRR
ncbi:hypothetical protein, partial [Neisseria meningitidis]|uniref:hypothetical protein n=1 Tax=Neisseria meningitidis TaxID=487 RepID=UPI003CC57D17